MYTHATMPQLSLWIVVTGEPDEESETAIYAFNCVAHEAAIEGVSATVVDADHVRVLVPGPFVELKQLEPVPLMVRDPGDHRAA